MVFGVLTAAMLVLDIWIHRAVQQHYLRGRRASPRAIREWARERFGRLAGYANQHLFLAARTGVLKT